MTPVLEAVTGFSADGLVIDDIWCEQQFQQHSKWLSVLDTNPKPLMDWLAPRYNPRLGYYFESLVEFWLRHTFAQHLIVPHLQVKNDRHSPRTIGEFDYLLADSATQRILHWEVAVKFYLYFQQPDSRILWYGPNPRDRLDLKLQRLFHHQLALSRLSAAQKTLQQAGLTWPVTPHLLLKGYLFYPSHSDWRHRLDTPDLSPQHARGWWTYLNSFEIPNAHEDRCWLYLPRLHWLAPAVVRGEAENALMDFAQLHSFCLDLLQRKQRPPLIAEMRRSETGSWQEVSRGFVVPQQWPAIIKKQ